MFRVLHSHKEKEGTSSNELLSFDEFKLQYKTIFGFYRTIKTRIIYHGLYTLYKEKNELVEKTREDFHRLMFQLSSDDALLKSQLEGKI